MTGTCLIRSGRVLVGHELVRADVLIENDRIAAWIAEAVAGEIPESEAPVQLTAVYHNLLRRWAEM